MQSPIVQGEDLDHEPEWTFKDYHPSTFPRARAPHVFLADGSRSIYDLFGTGKEYTLVDFTSTGDFAENSMQSAADGNTPIKIVHLPSEPHVRKVWERDAVLIRPDDHVGLESAGWRQQPCWFGWNGSLYRHRTKGKRFVVAESRAESERPEC
jgi:FAD-dependent monooxygenase